MNFSKIKAIVFDVDGVLTDGKLAYTSDGNEAKTFNIKDGQLIKYLTTKGIYFGCITGRQSPMVERRMQELGVSFLKQGKISKKNSFLDFLETYHLKKKKQFTLAMTSLT